jgi:hypothetical protein
MISQFRLASILTNCKEIGGQRILALKYSAKKALAMLTEIISVKSYNSLGYNKSSLK